ncbi:OmpA family protein [Flavobacterium alkalisoli]|uniref:OmpA family protein n=1 Tax=Flavobacterium alkalisoli TaxID=2602769 RepID=A0A5B9FUE2_9FLAO|nr:OmpA family protein [Flavobacterium alkalisoli]QEE50550.1 OmpA family protein [Flavobacterium alkalisoli]
MKKVVLPLLMICLTSASLKAQDVQETGNMNDFNKWSIDVNGGFSKPANPMSPGYHSSAFNFFHADLGFRYMFNTKFGLKLGAGYDKMSEDKGPAFESTLLSANLQGYANLGRIMEFESWTKTFNLLGHMGVGVGQLKNDDRFNGEDWIGSFLIGLTGQVRLSDRVALNADFTMVNSFSQQRTWDGGVYSPGSQQGFDSTLYNATLGLSIYLGKHQQHADWFVDEKLDELEALEQRIGEIETMMNDSDKDGVPDYLDAEPNSVTGVAVDTKGRAIDKNNNGVPDELESYLDQRTKEIKQEVSEGVSGDLAGLINNGYVNVYFDFNSDKPNAQSVSGINFLIKYLKQNPSVSADVVGYADEIGNSDYNKDLSARRAENVKKILVDAGIDAGRLNIVGNGEDTSVNKDSKYARQVVRRVTFILK